MMDTHEQEQPLAHAHALPRLCTMMWHIFTHMHMGYPLARAHTHPHNTVTHHIAEAEKRLQKVEELMRLEEQQAEEEEAENSRDSDIE